MGRRYGLGVPEIDENIKNWSSFLTASRCERGGRKTGRSGRIARSACGLYRLHFLHEEKLFLGTDISDADFHVAEHRALTVRVLDIQRKIRLGGVDGLSKSFWSS
jgi:hemerythrin